MSSDRKIILHFGLPKTGTTTIQNVFHANRDFLLRQEGVLYPSLAPNLTTPLCTIFQDEPHQHIANKMAGLTTEEESARQKKYRDSLEAEISSHAWNTLLLSAEGVSNLSAREIADLRSWGEKYSLDWSVIVCVRHPIAYVRSVTQQLMKGGDTLQQLYEQPPLPNFRGKISNVISVFGQENVQVFDFDAAIKDCGGIVAAFADQVGLTAASRDFLASRAISENESLSLEAVHILDSLNRQFPMFADNARAPRRSGPGHELAYISRIEGQKFDIPHLVKENIRSWSREDVAWLNGTFGFDLYRDVTDFVSHTESSREVPTEAWSETTIDNVAEIIGELVTESVFHRVLNGGKAALAQGNLDRAASMFQEAARLEPEASQPRELLEAVKEKQSSTSVS